MKQFSVEIQLDDYSNYHKVPMATLELTEDVTTGVIYNRTLTGGSVNLTLSFKVNSISTLLNYLKVIFSTSKYLRVRRFSHFPAPLQVICEENYYFDCSVFCVEQDDNLGHFTCDPVTGDPVCLEGWAGDDCLKSKFALSKNVQILHPGHKCHAVAL